MRSNVPAGPATSWAGSLGCSTAQMTPAKLRAVGDESSLVGWSCGRGLALTRVGWQVSGEGSLRSSCCEDLERALELRARAADLRRHRGPGRGGGHADR